MFKNSVRIFVLCALVAGALLAVPVKPAYAFVGHTLYVATTGNNAANNCQDIASPCATIVYAITQTVSGDRIYLAPGTYHESNIAITTNLEITGDAMHSTIIDAGAADRVFSITGTPTVYLNTMTIQNGLTGAAGGGINNTGTLYMWQVRVTGNHGDAGGGIYSSGALELDDSIVDNNLSNQSGGGLFLNQSGADSFNRVAVYSNQVIAASYYGGGIHQQGGGSLTLTNASLYNNTASTGGGIVNTGGSTLHILNSSISGNHATAIGGFANYSTADLKNTLLSGNDDDDCGNGGTLTDNGYNLLSDSSCGANLTDPHDLHSTAVLVNFVSPDWSGYVPVLAPLAGSATIDAGTNTGCPSDDARLVNRPVDGDLNGSAICDIGAYEYRPDSAISVTSDTPDPSRAGVPFTVQVAVTGAGPTPTGLVAVQMGETNCVATLSAGTGSCILTPSVPGVREIDVYHEGDAQYEGSSNFAAHIVTEVAKLSSSAAQDGWVLESSENSNVGGTMNARSSTFNLGDDASNRQYRAILHFDTSGLPDTAVVVHATLSIMKQGLVGTNPFTTHGALRVYLRKPAFGTPALQLSDFQSSPASPLVASFGATPFANVYSAILNAAGLANINRTGPTQFRLRFARDDNNDHGADFMKFFSGNSATIVNRPELDVEYYVP